MVARNRNLNKRMNYFERQFLRAQDLADEQDYHLDRRWRHNQFLHTPGVTNGLEVTQAYTKDNQKVDLNSVIVAPGWAIDADGWEIALLEAFQLTVNTPTNKETISKWGQRRATRFRYNPHVVLIPLSSLLSTAPWPAAPELRGAVCPPPIPLRSTNSASVSTESAR